jgi:hypothetical protein
LVRLRQTRKPFLRLLTSIANPVLCVMRASFLWAQGQLWKTDKRLF